jgi:hypothetical protein
MITQNEHGPSVNDSARLGFADALTWAHTRLEAATQLAAMLDPDNTYERELAYGLADLVRMELDTLKAAILAAFPSTQTLKG